MEKEVRILESIEALWREGAQEVIRRANEAVQQKGVFFVALSGGSTPKGLYSLLATDAKFRLAMPWAQTQFFWGDERPVPPQHPDSNFHMAWEAMLSKVPVPEANVHRLHGERHNLRQAAEEYELTLRQVFKLPPTDLPRFDLILLGMGADGHIASLFPGSTGLSERERLVIANEVPQLRAHRLTLTLPVLNNAACVLFLVSGSEKAEVLHAVLEKETQPEHYPARLVHSTAGKNIWLLDSAAASLLRVFKK